MSAIWSPLWVSLAIGAAGVSVALIPAAWTGWLLAREDFRGKRALAVAASSPLASSPLILGAYLLFDLAGRPEAFTPAIAAAAAACSAFPAIASATRRAFEALPSDYERAARSLGASGWRVFWIVEAPLVWRGIVFSSVPEFSGLAAEYAFLLFLTANADARHALLRGPLLPAIAALALVAMLLSARFERKQGRA
jgi:molybdate transport system permease protein